MTQDKYSLWKDAVTRTARSVARNFDEVDEEDLAQDLFVFILKTENLGNPDNPAVIATLYKKATSMAWEYRKVALAGTSQYNYRMEDVRMILETVFDRGDWDTSYLPEDQESEFTDDRWVANADVYKAYCMLPPNYQMAIVDRFHLGEPPVTSMEKSLLGRAIRRITDLLNSNSSTTEHKGPGSRRVISNAAAAAINIREGQ